MRKKDYEDDELLEMLDLYWEEACLRDPRKLSYAELSRYMEKNGIHCTANTLKHRKAVIDAMVQLRKTGTMHDAASDEPIASPSNSDQCQKVLKLLDLYIETFSEQFCLKHLVEEGLIDEQEFDLKPNFVKEAIITANQKPFENKFVKKIMAIAGLTEDEEAEETKEEEMESEINL